jgi:hypothetical protein
MYFKYLTVVKHADLYRCSKLVGVFGGHVHLDRSVFIEFWVVTELASLAMGDVETQIGDGSLDQGSGFEDLQLIVEKAGQVDGGQFHNVRQRGAGLAAVVVLFLDKNLCTGAINGCAVAKIHVSTAQTEDDTGNKPRPVCQILEKNFVKIDFLFGPIFAYARINVWFGHYQGYLLIK